MTKSLHNTYGRQVKSVAQFIQAVSDLSNKWSKTDGELFYPWFRGHANTDWPLVPAKYREPYISFDEDAYRSDFKLKAFAFLDGNANPPTDEWEWYFIMQHHGLPTRLLDWSESALVALYFALRDATPKQHAAVWVLDPWKLNEKVGQNGEWIMSSSDPEVKPYMLKPYPRQKRKLPAPPIALQPPLHSKRITAQRGVFTLHGKSRKALEDYLSIRKHLIKVEIAGSRIEHMKSELTLAGITETCVFPELPALCKELLDYWKE